MHKVILFLAAAALATACNSPHQGHGGPEPQAAVADARLPVIRYYTIADT